MAPEIPWEDKPDHDSLDKFEAAMFAIIALVVGALLITVAISAIIGLWHLGIITAAVWIGIFSGLFAIGRAIYNVILEKDIL